MPRSHTSRKTLQVLTLLPFVLMLAACGGGGIDPLRPDDSPAYAEDLFDDAVTEREPTNPIVRTYSSLALADPPLAHNFKTGRAEPVDVAGHCDEYAGGSIKCEYPPGFGHWYHAGHYPEGIPRSDGGYGRQPSESSALGHGDKPLKGLPSQRASDAHRPPIHRSANLLYVGADVLPLIGSIPILGYWDEVAVRYGSLDDVETNTLSSYLSDMAKQHSVLPHQALTLRFAEGTSEPHINQTIHAVRLINTALPRESRIQVSTDPVTPLSTERAPDGEIHIDFAPKSQWQIQNPAASAFAIRYFDPTSEYEQRPFGFQKLRSGRYSGRVISSLYDSDHPANEIFAIHVIVHELLHVLGLSHIEDNLLSDVGSIMNVGRSHIGATDQPRAVLFPVDRAGLVMLYGPRFRDEMSLGPWLDTIRHVRGDLPEVAFGVASQNGLWAPWSYGWYPATSLADSTMLSGSVTWRGGLLGFDTTDAAVAGDAAITVDMMALTGRADFTDLTVWTDKGLPETDDAIGVQLPGLPSRSTWGEGDLSYDLEVRGNTFTETGGDDGVLTGAFFGELHEGMGGILERDDLTAAFGGSR